MCAPVRLIRATEDGLSSTGHDRTVGIVPLFSTDENLPSGDPLAKDRVGHGPSDPVRDDPVYSRPR